MAYELTCTHKGKTRNISAWAGNLHWTDSMDSLGLEFSFDYVPGIYVGDLIDFKNGSTDIFSGIVTDVGFDGEKSRKVGGFDFAFYLNKSEVIVQFKGIVADKAIKKLCDMFDVSIGSISNMPTKIKKIYKDKVVYDVIKDILKQVRNETGENHRLEMRKGKLYIVKSGSIKVEPYYYDETGKKIISTTTCNITSGNRSIQEMRNKIIVAGSGEKATSIKATAKDSASIKKHGLLSQVETGDKLTAAKARNIAKNKLKQLNRIQTKFTAEMQGGVSTRSGRLIYFNRPEVSVIGWYLCRSCSHQITNGIHKLTCEMEKP